MIVPKLSTRSLTKSFVKGERELTALRDLSIEVADGEFVSIVGASGCGKTTFLRLIDGLVPPTSGYIEIDGRKVEKPGPDIAFVFQNDGLLPWRTVQRNVSFGPELQRRDRAAYLRAAQEMLRLVGLGGFGEHYPHELSGGMRQRVNIARALTVGADVLLMDEPFAALDSQTREIMQGELMRICREAKKTVLFVTHQIDEAVYLSDRVLIFTARPGRLKEEVVIDLPRPRALSVKRTPEFVRYTDRIWRAIEEEVRESIGLEVQSLARNRA
jgi:NitT/TauT family transport system ATP-binding protein